MAELHPAFEPHAQGMLDVGDGNKVAWREYGNPDGKPAVCVHGGPGTGCPAGMGTTMDPTRYRIVQFDQRGSGQSTPHASDPTADLSVNTTEHLIADMEQLRVTLGIDRWLLYGGSWGTTLALAYAQRFPDRVSEMVLSAISTTRPREIDWLYRGAARFFPAEWARFRDHLPAADRDGNLPAAYSRLMADPSAEVRAAAALEWGRWEDTVLSLEPGGRKLFPEEATPKLLAFVRICAHFYANYGWLEDGVLIREAHRLAGIPGVLVHGRLDLSCPTETAVELADAWPGVELVLLDDTGHKGSPTRRDALVAALNKFAP